jgi:broad specificity phosphatase PhoE
MSDPGAGTGATIQPDTTRIVLVRHGETDYNREDRWQGVGSDVPLNDTGRAQAIALADALVERFDEQMAALYTSDLRRARETAAIMAARLGLTPWNEPGLRELSHGSWEGRTHAEVKEIWPEEYALYEADPYRVRRGGGDSYADLEKQVWPALERMAERHPGRRVVAVSHGGPIRLALSRILDLPLADRDALGVINGSWFEISRGPGGWSVASSGRIRT